jgi:hypothetical protein
MQRTPNDARVEAGARLCEHHCRPAVGDDLRSSGRLQVHTRMPRKCIRLVTNNIPQVSKTLREQRVSYRGPP